MSLGLRVLLLLVPFVLARDAGAADAWRGGDFAGRGSSGSSADGVSSLPTARANPDAPRTPRKAFELAMQNARDIAELATKTTSEATAIKRRPVQWPPRAMYERRSLGLPVSKTRTRSIVGPNASKRGPRFSPVAARSSSTPSAGFVTCEREVSALRNCQAAATAVRHGVIATARSARCVWAETRWRWTLKVL